MRVTQLFLSRTDHVGTGEYHERKLRQHSPGLRITGDRDDRDYDKVIPVMVEITLWELIYYSSFATVLFQVTLSPAAQADLRRPNSPAFREISIQV